jgi:NMD protein affecting ribosome stability and mRNA decay
MSLEKICPSCGKSKVEFIGSFCKDCYLGKNKLVEAPRTVEIVRCRQCGKMISGSAEDLVKSKTKTNHEGTVEYAEGKAVYETEIDGVKIRQEFPIEVKIRERLCERCGRIKSGYYEAIIQVRNGKEEEIIKKLENETFITKIEKQKTGVDIYAGRVGAARKTLKKMGLRAPESKKLYGMRKGRNLYRTTFIVR